MLAQKSAALDSYIFELASLAFPVSDGLADDVAQQIFDITRRAIARAARGFNATLKVNLLPSEVLAAVFGALPLGRRFTASHVCTRWRDVALDSPELWTDIRAHSFADRARTYELFTRSKAAPLSVSSPHGGANHDEKFMGLLFRHLGHTKVLNIKCWPIYAVLLLQRPIPIMERLRIQADITDSDALSPLHCTPETFQQTVPSLVDLSLQLTGAAEPLRSGRLEEVLVQCPALRRLYLDFRHSSVDVTLDRPIKDLARSLDEVRICGKYTAVEAMLPSLSACSHVGVDALVENKSVFLPKLLDDLGALHQLVLSSVQPKDGWETDKEIMRARSGPFTRALLQWARNMAIPSIITLHAASLVSLTLSEPYWRGLRLPKLPALQTLILTTWPGVAASSRRPRPPARSWIFPSLQHVCVGNFFPSMLSDTMECPFQRTELSFILRKAMGFSPKRRLRRLDIVNIELAGAEAEPGHRVKDLVEQLDMRRDEYWNGSAV